MKILQTIAKILLPFMLGGGIHRAYTQWCRPVAFRYQDHAGHPARCVCVDLSQLYQNEYWKY